MKTRILTSLVGAPLMLLLMFWPGGWPWFWFVAALMAMTIYEFSKALWAKGIYVHWFGIGLFGAIGMLLAKPTEFAWNYSLGPLLNGFHVNVFPDLIVFFAMALLAGDLVWKRRSPLKNLGATFVGIGWMSLTLPYLMRIREASGYDLTFHHANVPTPRVEIGAWLMLAVLLVIWAGDSGAYFVGKAFGKHKMAPAISPNKTWEGSIGGLAASWAIGAAVMWPLGLGAWLPLLFGLIVGVAGQIGDLVESAIKREIGIKDFGDLLPGHGGVLDRFDSLLFAAPTAHLVMRWLLGVNWLR